MADQQYYEGIGRRKEASARVRVHSGGNGAITINDKTGAD
jgi:ribosomal protein S9